MFANRVPVMLRTSASLQRYDRERQRQYEHYTCIVSISSAAREWGKVHTMTEVMRITSVVGHLSNRVVGRDILRAFFW